MKAKHILLGSLILICSLIVYKLTMNKQELDSRKKTTKSIEVSIPVKIAQVKDTLLETAIMRNGVIIPFKESKALATISGNLKNVRFELGDFVSKGQILASIDDRTQQLDLQKVERNAEKLKSDLQTYSELLRGNAATQEKVNDLRANYQDALTQVGIIKKNISDAVIKAPLSGVISQKFVENGMYVNTGNEVATILDLTKTKAEVFLSENDVYQVKKGQVVEITVDVLPHTIFKGIVDFISPQADETRSYKTDILVDNKSYTLLRSGTYVNVKFLGSENLKTLLIPRDALVGSIKEPVVFVVNDNKVNKRIIKTGIEVQGYIQVVDGLKADEKVVLSGQINLKDGSIVKVSQ